MEKIYKQKRIPKNTTKTIQLIEKYKTEKFLNEVFIGKILGDATINKTGNLCIAQGVQQKDYVEHCFDLFISYIRPGRKIYSYMNKRKGKLHEILSFETCAIFKEYLNIFYRYEEGTNKRIKIIPNNIGDYLTLRSLAYWIMDDGCFYTNTKLAICTHSFTLEENLLLIEVIQNKFSLPCSLLKTKQSINKELYWYYLSINDSSLLWELVKDYILPSFYYKFGKGPKPMAKLELEN